MTCYKDLQHANCTESFYKDSVTAEIQNRDLDKDSKANMLAMLKRLEEENDPEDLFSDDDEQLSELQQRFEHIDIENTDPAQIWDLLSDQERKEFEVTLKELQHSGDWDKLHMPTYIPWWKQSIPLIQEQEDEESDIPQLPATLPNFETMTKAATRDSPHLAWNLLNILATYSYLMRHCLGELLEDIKDTIKHAKILSAHVLYSNRPECPYTSVGDVIGDIVERIISIEDGSDIHKRGKMNNHKRYDLRILLLQDADDLLKECRRATCDFWQALDHIPKKEKLTQLAVRKLYFYFAAACYLDRERMDIIRMGIQAELNKVKAEKEEFQRDFEAAQNAIKQHREQKERDSIVKIQEL